MVEVGAANSSATKRRVVLVGVRRRVEGAWLAEPLGELREALCVHVLRVHEEGAPEAAPVTVPLEHELRDHLKLILEPVQRRGRQRVTWLGLGVGLGLGLGLGLRSRLTGYLLAACC